MATLDWSRCPAVESIPGKVGGAWVFRGTRLPVATVIENLEDLSVEEVMAQFDVSREQIVRRAGFRCRKPAGSGTRRCAFCLITVYQPGLLGHCQGTPSPPHRPKGGIV